jgi:myo-inositol-1(or 4)-monophosphatase
LLSKYSLAFSEISFKNNGKDNWEKSNLNFHGNQSSLGERNVKQAGAIMNLNLVDALSSIRAVAVEQGQVLINGWPTLLQVMRSDKRDFTTDLDLIVEKNIRDFIEKHFPDHGISGEELGSTRMDSDYCWMIDPIDGTKNFAGHSSLFSISIALLHHNEPILGLVHDVTAGCCFYALKDSGAFLDDKRLTGPAIQAMPQVIANVDMSATDRLPADEKAWFETKLVELTRRIFRIRSLGVGALATCWVASGALDAYIDLTGYVKPQDIAAGRIIMKEAGLRVDYIHPPHGPARLLAAPVSLWDSFVEILKR